MRRTAARGAGAAARSTARGTRERARKDMITSAGQGETLKAVLINGITFDQATGKHMAHQSSPETNFAPTKGGVAQMRFFQTFQNLPNFRPLSPPSPLKVCRLLVHGPSRRRKREGRLQRTVRLEAVPLSIMPEAPPRAGRAKCPSKTGRCVLRSLCSVVCFEFTWKKR